MYEHFKQEVEKVVGYMSYVKDRIFVTLERAKLHASLATGNGECADLENAYKRAALSITLIEKYMDELIQNANAYILGKKSLEQDREEAAALVKSTLGTLIRQMEKFESVQLVAGYENLDRLTTFDDLQALLIPEVKKLRTQVKAFEPILAALRQQENDASVVNNIFNPGIPGLE